MNFIPLVASYVYLHSAARRGCLLATRFQILENDKTPSQKLTVLHQTLTKYATSNYEMKQTPLICRPYVSKKNIDLLKKFELSKKMFKTDKEGKLGPIYILQC